MNHEELKLILDTVREVSQTAGIVGVVWVLLHYIVQLATVIAAPIATAFAVARVANYAHKYLVARQTTIEVKAAVPSGDMIEKTRQAAIALEAERIKASTSAATQQLKDIAAAAGLENAVIDGSIYRSDLTKVIDKLKQKT